MADRPRRDESQEESFALMERLAAGDTAALEGLYERWGGPVLSFIERMCGNRVTAEDLLQEVFLRVWRAAPRYQPTAKFSTWLFQIARNATLNELEKRTRRPRPLGLDTADS